MARTPRDNDWQFTMIWVSFTYLAFRAMKLVCTLPVPRHWFAALFATVATIVAAGTYFRIAWCYNAMVSNQIKLLLWNTCLFIAKLTGRFRIKPSYRRLLFLIFANIAGLHMLLEEEFRNQFEDAEPTQTEHAITLGLVLVPALVAALRQWIL